MIINNFFINFMFKISVKNFLRWKSRNLEKVFLTKYVFYDLLKMFGQLTKIKTSRKIPLRIAEQKNRLPGNQFSIAAVWWINNKILETDPKFFFWFPKIIKFVDALIRMVFDNNISLYQFHVQSSTKWFLMKKVKSRVRFLCATSCFTFCFAGKEK